MGAECKQQPVTTSSHLAATHVHRHHGGESRGAGNEGSEGSSARTEVVEAPRTASATVQLKSQLASQRLTAWLPAISRTFAYTDLLPSTLVPQLDACLGRFIVSPVQKAKDWCARGCAP